MTVREAKIAADIGGTFTDVVLEVDGTQVSTKVLTTYDDPANGVLDGLRQVLAKEKCAAADIGLVLHGTTLATNALIQRRGARTALLTTEGHRDAIEMAFENRFEQYDIDIDRPAPLVPRKLRLPIKERIAADGEVLVPLDEGSVAQAIATLQAQAVESVAVGFLHAYQNADHERRVAELVRAQMPELSITLASEVCPEIREFERLSTACANAYVRPLMARYLESLQTQLSDAGVRCPLLMMTSGGGLTNLHTAARFPIRLVESGPAGGAILASHVAARCGFDRVLSFDMGGTTAKICLIDDAQPLLSRAFEVDRSYRFKKGSGLPVRVPVIEMVEIGAGGGSIARVDKLSHITVGPDSAGSEPGPAAYGRGGDSATVTDADVLLGKLRPELFAGGALKLDQDASRRVVDKHVAKTLSMSIQQSAVGITEVIDENMVAAARAHAMEWGKDNGGRTLIAYGGAAPLHACQLASKLKIQRIVIPNGAGVGSAIGFLLAPVRYEVVRSHYQRLQDLDRVVLDKLFAELREEAYVVVHAATAEPLNEARRAYMRYVGQGYEIAVDVPELDVPDFIAAMSSAFHAAYRRLYGRVIPGLDVEILSWTLSLGTTVDVAKDVDAPELEREASAHDVVDLYDPVQGGEVRADLYLRSDLRPGDYLSGPALIVEEQTTTVVTSAYTLIVNQLGYLIMQRRDI